MSKSKITKLRGEWSKRPRLVDEGMVFIESSKEKGVLEERKLQASHENLVIRNFWVHISNYDPSTGKVTEWRKEEGYSLWRVQGDRE